MIAEENLAHPVVGMGSDEKKKAHTFSKGKRLLIRAEFLSVTETGKKTRTKSFLVFTKPNSLGYSRIGITVSRKVGNAVKRNRIKRLVREFFRLNKTRIDAGLDIVVIATREAVGKGFEDISRELLRTLAPPPARRVETAKTTEGGGIK